MHSMVMTVVTASSLQPGILLAASATQQPAPDLQAFDRGFRSGQDEFNRHEFLAAARVWTGAAGLLPEADEHKENRRAIYEYIAEAYEKAIEGGAKDDVLREGLAILDAYAAGFTAAHPSDTLPEHVTKTRLLFRTRIDESEAERMRREKPPDPVPVVVTPPPEPVRPPPKPWKGLAIGGGVAVAGGVAMLGMFGAGVAGAKSAEAKFDDPANACDLNNPMGECVDFNSQGKRSNAVAVAGLITAPLLLGAGVALLVIASRRKAKRTVLAPLFSPSMAGVVWQQRF